MWMCGDIDQVKRWQGETFGLRLFIHAAERLRRRRQCLLRVIVNKATSLHLPLTFRAGDSAETSVPGPLLSQQMFV